MVNIMPSRSLHIFSTVDLSPLVLKTAIIAAPINTNTIGFKVSK